MRDDLDLLVLPLPSYPEGVWRPIDSVLIEEYEAHGYTTARQIINVRDTARENETAGQLRRQRLPRCPTCSHGARMWPLYHKDAWKCRWGHETSRRDLLTKK